MRRGFTLLELTIVLLIISVVIGTGVVTFTASLTKKQYDATLAKMAVIDKALVDFSVAFGRIPCPASLTLTTADSNYAIEAANQGSCTGGTPAANYTSSSGVAEGAIPVRALKLPDSFMFDGWGRRFRYAVDPTMTSSNALPVAVGGLCSASNSAITLTGATSTSAAIYAIISHGSNGHGGFTANGVMLNSGSVNANEQKNCHCDNTATATANDASYVQKSTTSNAANKLDSFDDIVSYKEAWQMRNANTTAFAPACLYIADSTNNALRKYSTLSTSWSSMTSSFNAPAGIAVNSNGDIFVADKSNNKIQKYTISTASWSNFVTGLSTPSGVAVDSSGNVFVANTGGNNIKKYNSAGTLQTTYTNSFSSPYGVYVDSSNTIYVADTGNNYLQKYNGSTWSTIGTSGSILGRFSAPKGVYADKLGNIWVADTGNNRIQKYNGSSWYAWGGTASNTTIGYFNAPTGITGDAMGNIWVTDSGNNRVMLFANGIWNLFAGYSGSNTAFSNPAGITTSK